MKDLKLVGVRDDVIFELRADHGFSRQDANKYWDAFHKGTRGLSTVGLFDEALIERDFTKEEVEAFLDEQGANKTSALGFYVSRASLARKIKDSLK